MVGFAFGVGSCGGFCTSVCISCDGTNAWHIIGIVARSRCLELRFEEQNTLICMVYICIQIYGGPRCEEPIFIYGLYKYVQNQTHLGLYIYIYICIYGTPQKSTFGR